MSSFLTFGSFIIFMSVFYERPYRKRRIVKMRVKTMPICPLCKKLVPHFKANSHIIPEWMYKGSQIYDKKGRVIIRGDSQNKKGRKISCSTGL